MSKFLALLTLPLLAATAIAQNSVEPGLPPAIPRYTVEIIIFSYQQDVSTGTEIFVPDTPPPVEELDEGDFDSSVAMVSLPEVVTAEAAENTADPKRKFEISMLAEEDFTLQNIADRLVRLDVYKPLMHFGWTQTTYPEEETEARPLSSYATPPPGLQGDLKLYLSRYLHLALNLQMAAPGTQTNGGQSDGRDYLGSEPVSFPVHYRINEDRIFRHGELRYFDHPKFGVLAKITRADNAPGDDANPESEAELLGDGE